MKNISEDKTMNVFDIFVDSAANLPDSIRSERNINVIPYNYIINGKEYPCLEEGVPFTESAKKFYSAMRAGADAKTSLIGEERFIEAVTPSLEAGRDVVILTIASGISGTHQQAKAAVKTLSEKYPKRTIEAVDSANASLGEGLLAIKAADLRDMGQSAEATAKWLKDNAYKMNSYLTVGDLKYLRRSGRISTALAVAGTLLSIKPIIKADGGALPKLAFAGREHGRKKAISALVRYFAENVEHPETQTIAIAHADCEDDAHTLADMLKEYGVQDIIIEYYDICTGAHAGPGTLAVFFMGKDRRGELAPKAQKAVLRKRVTEPTN